MVLRCARIERFHLILRARVIAAKSGHAPWLTRHADHRIFWERVFDEDIVIMATGTHREYRYLDTDSDRQQLIDEIKQVRRAVLSTADSIPEARHHEARYHGWSLSAMLMHLQVMDNLALLSMQMAIIGVRPPIPIGIVNQFNDFTAGIFQQRLVATTMSGIRRNEKRITEFIWRLPISKFTKQVYYPSLESYLTVERALQEYFLYHWQEHLHTIRSVEGIFYEPPGRQDAV